VEIEAGESTPEEVGDRLGSEASKIVTGHAKRGEIMSWMEVGAEYTRYVARLKKAASMGIELGVYTGLKFVDDYTLGLQPTELMIVAGEPGVGKSAITWEMSLGFAQRQMTKPPERRVGTLVLSLEMGLIGSSGRLATSLTGVPGNRLREGKVSDDELRSIVQAWKGKDDLPLFFNFASNFRMSQMRALIVEAIRRHNVGLIVVDHFRMFDPDRRINNATQEDEAKARFLKEDVAKDLNVAVLCLAHTIKIKREFSDGRPQLSDLRGSGQVAAHTDITTFMYRPWMYASENEKAEGIYSPLQAELIFRKNRNAAEGASEFVFDPSLMRIKDVV
jgi:replicative DNA helicase